MENNLPSVKAYLYKMTPEFHKALVQASSNNDMTIHEFITAAIKNMMAESEKK